MKQVKDIITDGYAKLNLYRFSGIRERILNLVSKQDSETSFVLHHSEYDQPNAVERTRGVYAKYEKQDTFNQPVSRFRDFLEKHPQVRYLAVDIGCGAGWISAKLSKQFQSVVAIEPSSSAISIAKQLFPSNEYPNIDWRVGFAEKEIKTISIDQPVAFFTSTVLSHLQDHTVIPICDSIDACAPKGSILAFSECWGKKSYNYMWYVRTKEWWRERFPKWEIDFFGPTYQNVKGRHKGFHAVKVRD